MSDRFISKRPLNKGIFCQRVLILVICLITAKLVIESVSFGRVRIRGSATNFYLCVDKRGRLRARVSLQPFLGFKMQKKTTHLSSHYWGFQQTSQWEYRLGNNWQDFWMSCLFRTFLEPELPYNGCSNYVIKSIFVLCFENTVTIWAKTKESSLRVCVFVNSDASQLKGLNCILIHDSFSRF